MQSMRKEPMIVRAAALAFCVAAMPLVTATASVVTDWNAIATTVIVTNAGKPPGIATIDFVYVNAAMYDAVNAIDGRYSVYAVSPTNATVGASEDAAAVAAAHNVLKAFYPLQQAYLDARYAESLAA